MESILNVPMIRGRIPRMLRVRERLFVTEMKIKTSLKEEEIFELTGIQPSDFHKVGLKIDMKKIDFSDLSQLLNLFVFRRRGEIELGPSKIVEAMIGRLGISEEVLESKYGDRHGEVIKNLQLLVEESKEKIKEFNEWKQANPDLIIDLSGLDLSGLRLDGVDLSNTILWGTDFARASLHKAIFKGADASRAKFMEAFLAEADCAGMKVFGTNFSRAKLYATQLRGIIGISTTTKFMNATINHSTVLPSDFKPEEYGIIETRPMSI